MVLISNPGALLKKCKICGKDLTLDQYYKNAKNKDGLLHSCKLCVRKKSADYAKLNLEKRRAYYKVYYDKHKQHMREYMRKYRREHGLVKSGGS